ncbi:uncharacterized protein OCT59_004717 [Rhizophagus irregularis]|uniref:uncharacterized protein n=1 Tax=Rhizophagus irregularis TaxID=588596 RepID=UPI003325476E|nr:hypothetical protein OCT59_004717 [Rhizophagus irregularis]
MEILGFRDLTAGKKIIAENFANWTSGNEIIDNFIREKQLNYDGSVKAVFEWIPYNEFIDIKEIGKNCFFTAIWKEGPLFYYKNENEWTKTSYEVVTLKFLYGLQNITDELINNVETYLKSDVIFGISQNPDTKVYLLVFNVKYFNCYCEKCGNEYDSREYKWCKQCQTNQLKNDFTNWTSRNLKLDYFIQKMQLKINNYDDTIFEWIPYNEFIIIKELENYTLTIWKKGPLYYNTNDEKLVRKSYERVYLKFLYVNSQEITDEFSKNEIESYLKNDVIFGISQNPDTKVYILVFNNKCFDHYCEKCDNEYDDKNRHDKIFEWIPYNEFIIIKESEKYTLAIWEKDNTNDKKFVRKSRERVHLKYLYNSQEITTEFSNEVESYLKNDVIFGISQNPDTEVYLLVFNDEYFKYYCEKCDSEYDRKELGNNVLATAIWKDGPLYYSSVRRSYDREINKNVILKYLCNSQNVSQLFSNEVIYSVEKNYGVTQNPITKDYMLVCKIESSGCERKSNTNVALKCLSNFDEFINEAKAYPHQNILKIYGISQNPTTKNYIMVLEYAEVYHDDFHTRNILFTKCKPSFLNNYADYIICIMGLCKKIDDINETNIFGVMSYIAPEVLKGKPYTQAADIYSFGIIIYVIATGKQPFINCTLEH